MYILLLLVSSLLLISCSGSKHAEFFNLANEQMNSGYEWNYIGRKDATTENIKYIPMYSGPKGEEYIHFQLQKPES